MKFRVLTVTHILDDSRVSREMEKIDLPGVEICPVDIDDYDAFSELADNLWFCIRVLLTFELRQYVSPVREQKTSKNEIVDTWHAIEIEPRGEPDDRHDPPYRGQRLETFLTKGVRALWQHQALLPQLHAAAYSYADSYKSRVMEGGLTSCVEAIEGLVGVFEEIRSLSKHVIDDKKWKLVSKTLKGSIAGIELPSDAQGRVKRHLGYAPRLTLEERINRMAKYYALHRSKNYSILIDGIGLMIGARNSIVHGRLVDDVSKTYVELLRAQSLFAKLFLCLCGCASFETPGYAQVVISSHYAGLIESRESTPPMG